MESRIKIRLGAVEVEYEGSESFLKKELPELIRTVSELLQATGAGTKGDGDKDSDRGTDSGAGGIQLSTNSIATKLGVKSGSDLAVAAAAHLTFVKGTYVFSRQDLLKEMKTATSFYKGSYSNNLSSTLKGLLKSKFNEPSTGKFALTAKVKEELRSTLA